MKMLIDKVALITGGARGMGLNHVKRFVDEGAKVYFSDILEEAGQQLANECDGRAVFIKHDVSKEAEWKSAVELIERNEGKLDILVNNAGISVSQSIEMMTAEMYMNVINVNQFSVFLGLKYAFPLLKKSGSASVINTSSIIGIRANKGDAAYSSSKFAIRGMTQVAAQEFAPYNIRVNSVHPGLVETPMVMIPEYKSVIDALIEKTPLKRGATLDDASNMVLFLASDASSFCTASEFVLDGGATCGF